jgi:hypothetical protein
MYFGRHAAKVHAQAALDKLATRFLDLCEMALRFLALGGRAENLLVDGFGRY